MNIPKDLKYTKAHEWIKKEDNLIYVGITDYAQNSLGDVVFVELPEVGDKVIKDDVFGVVESVKAASDIYAPLSGTVQKVNDKVLDYPEEINKDPYENWMIVIEPSDLSELTEFLDAGAYEKLCEEED